MKLKNLLPIHLLLEFADAKRVYINPITRKESADFIKEHYLGKFPPRITDYIGIFYEGIELPLVGVIVYGAGSSPGITLVPSIVRPLNAEEAAKVGKMEGELPITEEQLIELKRLYIRELPSEIRQNLASMSITKANKLMESKYPDKRIMLSYSDPLRHEGTVYKATNAIFLGKGKDYKAFKRKKDDIVMRLSVAKKKWRENLKDMGEIVPVIGKEKYIWLLGNNRNRKYIEKFIKKSMSV